MVQTWDTWAKKGAIHSREVRSTSKTVFGKYTAIFLYQLGWFAMVWSTSMSAPREKRASRSVESPKMPFFFNSSSCCAIHSLSRKTTFCFQRRRIRCHKHKQSQKLVMPMLTRQTRSTPTRSLYPGAQMDRTNPNVKLRKVVTKQAGTSDGW